MFVADGTFPPTVYCFFKVGNAPLSSYNRHFAACGLQGGVHGINCFCQANVSTVHLRTSVLVPAFCSRCLVHDCSSNSRRSRWCRYLPTSRRYAHSQCYYPYWLRCPLHSRQGGCFLRSSPTRPPPAIFFLGHRRLRCPWHSKRSGWHSNSSRHLPPPTSTVPFTVAEELHPVTEPSI